MQHLAHKFSQLSAIPSEHSRLPPERSLRKLNSMRGEKSMQDLMVCFVRMKNRSRNSAQSEALLCRPVREHIRQWLSTAPYPKGGDIDPVHL